MRKNWSKYCWEKAVGVLLGFAFLLTVAPQAFADVKAIVVIECDPHTGVVVHAQASSGSPVSGGALMGNQCTDAMVYLDGIHFKVKDTLREVSATTINEASGTTAGTGPAWYSNYLYVFYLD